MMIGECRADKVRVPYRLHSVMGEPIPGASVTWSGPVCSVPAGATALYLHIQNGSNSSWLRVLIGPSRAGGPEVRGTGSAFWGSLICSYRGIEAVGCVDAATARSLYYGGTIVGFRFGNA